MSNDPISYVVDEPLGISAEAIALNSTELSAFSPTPFLPMMLIDPLIDVPLERLHLL
jgi:hypothetical protein